MQIFRYSSSEINHLRMRDRKTVGPLKRSAW